MQASAAATTRGRGHRLRPALGPLAGLLVIFLAVSGHARSEDLPPAAVGDPLAQVFVEREGTVIAHGSAVVIAEREEADGPACYLLTVGHVVSSGGGPASKVVVVLPGEGGPPRRLTGALVRQVDAGERDLALLRVTTPTCRPARVGAPVEVGADVWLVGFAAEGAPRVFGGHVRETPRPDGMRFTVDGVATEGTSGGGVFDARTGRLLGLIQGYWTVRLVTSGGRVAEAPAGTTAVVPISGVRALLEEWGVEDLLDTSPAAP